MLLVRKYVTMLRVLAAAGIIKPYSPVVLVRMARTLLAWGTGPAGGFTTLAQRDPHRVGLVDELGELTFLGAVERVHAGRALRRLVVRRLGHPTPCRGWGAGHELSMTLEVVAVSS